MTNSISTLHTCIYKLNSTSYLIHIPYIVHCIKLVLIKSNCRLSAVRIRIYMYSTLYTCNVLYFEFMLHFVHDIIFSMGNMGNITMMWGGFFLYDEIIGMKNRPPDDILFIFL